MKILTARIALEHLQKYSQYTGNKNWISDYSKIAPLKAERTAKLLLNYKDSRARVLDLGCGIGLTTAGLIRYFPCTVGCDIGRTEVLATKQLLLNLGVNGRVIRYNGVKLPFADKTFDIVTSIEVFEHVADIDQMLKEIKRVLKPDGILHITTANRWWPIEPHYHLLFLSYLPKDLASKYLKMTGRGTDYANINLPNYEEFYKAVNWFFKIEDVTLDVIKNYKKYGLDKERGFLIPIVGEFLKTGDSLGKVSKLINYFLIRASLGWLFVAEPRK